jgi:crossover junction endodeoxyribonuclease RusA
MCHDDDVTSLGFRVYGIPAPQGSKNSGVSATTGKSFVYEQSSKTLKPWRTAIKEAALAARGDTPTKTGPIALSIILMMPRPASVSEKKRKWPSVRPDLDKMIRGVCDALKEAGIYKDDAQVVQINAEKRYATDDIQYSPGAWIVVAEIT